LAIFDEIRRHPSPRHARVEERAAPRTRSCATILMLRHCPQPLSEVSVNEGV
jgi:hypothetical protein